MSDIDPQYPQESDYTPGQDFGTEMVSTGPAPISGMAVAALVCSILSIIPCCSILLCLLGLVFGLVGIVQTREGRRRGRGLAIISVVLAVLLGLPVSIWSVSAGTTFLKSEFGVMQAVEGLKDNDPQASAKAFYEFCSPAYKEKVSEQALSAWLKAELDERGRLQGVTISQKTQPSGSRLLWDFPLQFPDSTATLQLVIGYDWLGHWLLEDIKIDDKSALPEAETQDTDADIENQAPDDTE